MKYELINIGEIRFGPPFYKLKIDGIEIADRIFGEVKYEENSGRYIVLQEWLSTDYAIGPQTRPFIITIRTKKYAVLSNGKAGFADDFKIDEDVLIYTQMNKGAGINKSYECDLKMLKFEDVF